MNNRFLQLITVLELVATAALAGTAMAGDSECRHTSREHFVSGWKTADAVRVIHAPLTPDGVVYCAFYPDQSQKLNVRVAYETGIFKGAEYRIYYSDGSGKIQGSDVAALDDPDTRVHWALNCRATSSERSHCSLKKADLEITRSPDGKSTLSLGHAWAENSGLLLRIDRHWAIEAQADVGFSADQSLLLMQQLQSGRVVDTRFHATGNRHPTYKTLSLFGFSQALEIVDQVIRQASGQDKNPT